MDETMLVPLLACYSHDCRHDHGTADDCEPGPPCVLWGPTGDDRDCEGCLGNGRRLDMAAARAASVGVPRGLGVHTAAADAYARGELDAPTRAATVRDPKVYEQEVPRG